MTAVPYWPPEHPESDICLLCGLEGWSCICDPCAAGEPTGAEIEQARESRLTRSERSTSAL